MGMNSLAAFLTAATLAVFSPAQARTQAAAEAQPAAQTQTGTGARARTQTAAPAPPAAPKAKLGDSSAGSRGQPAHIIALRDPEGDTIQPGDRRPLPFSTLQTCGGDCHDVAAISRGWHFNAALPGVPAGRKGQPWLLVDRETGTQMPLSYRTWPGTYRPQQLGMSSREFAIHFGGRMPGGVTADESDRRWMVSGSLEVNCLVCHDASPAYDQAEYSHQVAQENFRYAPAAASGLALVTGSSKEMPDLFDYLMPNSVEDSLHPRIPTVEYSPSHFLPSGKVAFDIVREVKSSRCYYCHTNADVELTGQSRWKANEDIHLARGIACVQCHRNGLDHMISRGSEGGAAAAFSCEGCHAESNAMGAPHPDHEGIPPVHFRKLTCTACHSGPLPAANTRQLKNGMAHGLGEFNVNKSAQALPHIYYPVFAQQEDGKIGPNRLIWPAFWGRLRQGTVQPIHPDQVRKVIEKGKLNAPLSADGSWPQGDEHWVAQVLALLEEDAPAQGPAVYIAGGKLHRLDGVGKVAVEDHSQAQPYLWPMAHDVRPASQALGAKSCQECHSEDAAIFFGNVAVDSPLAADRAARWKMIRFEKDVEEDDQLRLARSWRYRPWLKGLGLGAAGLLLLFLLAYGLRALERLSAATVGRLR
jgi:hypothetical protein